MLVLAEVLQRYGHPIQKAEVKQKLKQIVDKFVYDEYLCAGSTILEKANRIIEELSK